MGFTALAPLIATGASVASMGMNAASTAVKGAGTQLTDQTLGQNALLTGQSTSTNALLQGATQAANYTYQGASEQAQYGLQSGQYAEEAASNTAAAQAGILQASLVDVSARQQLTTTLGNIATMRAAGGADFTSPTTVALEGYNYNTSEINRTSQEATINTQTEEEQAAAEYENASSTFALLQGTETEAMGTANAASATAFGNYNSAVALQYGDYNSTQAQSAGNMGLMMGYFGASGTVLGGISTAFNNVPAPTGIQAGYSYPSGTPL